MDPLENPIRIYAISTSYSLGAAIAGGLGVPIYHTHSEKFSDGELFVRFDESVRGQDVFIVAKVHMPYENFFELLLTIDAARRSSAREVVLVIPYLPHSRQERRDGQRTAISSRIIADMIQSLGADRILTLDLHTNAIEGFYKIPLDPLSTKEIFLRQIQVLQLENLCLCSPDFGGIKRIKEYKKELDVPMVVLNKERLRPNRVSSMEIIGEVEGKDVVIIDDIIDTAGTLCRAADLLVEHGATSVQAFCTHGILSGDARQTIANSAISKVFVTDTVLEAIDDPKISVISSAPIFVHAIQSMIKNRSRIIG